VMKKGEGTTQVKEGYTKLYGSREHALSGIA
jgi:hypothetical protein